MLASSISTAYHIVLSLGRRGTGFIHLVLRLSRLRIGIVQIQPRYPLSHFEQLCRHFCRPGNIGRLLRLLAGRGRHLNIKNELTNVSGLNVESREWDGR